MTARRRIGIRALLLAMLLPSMAALLALDAWRDHRAISRAVVDAHDQILIEPVQALNEGLQLAADGQPQLAAAFSVQSMFASTASREQQLRVAAVPLAPSGPERLLLGSADLPPPPPGPDDAPAFYDADWHGRPLRIAALRRTLRTPDGQGWRVLIQAAEGTGTREQILADAWQQAFWNDLAMMLLMVALVWLGVALSLRPLERLRRSLAAREPGDLAPLDVRGVPHEVAPLVAAVNHHMASQSQLLESQRRFLADASHQLRTPLAIMLTQAGFALREHEVEPMRETLRAIAGQLGRARRLSEQLLSLAQASDAAPDDGPAPRADLNQVAREVVLEYLPLAREKRQDLGWVDARGELADAADGAEGEDGQEEGVPVAPVAAAASDLHEALANLLHNAIRYTPAGGRITVSVRLDGGFALAEVSDTGPGIAAAQRERVFERFQRGVADAGGMDAGTGTGTRTSAKMDAPPLAQPGGAGLGLAIARAYARRNGGEISLGDAPAFDAPARGLRACLRLPLLGSNPISDNTYFAERPPR